MVGATAWWCICRLPFWRPLPDFFDSPEYRWRVEGGFWNAFHNTSAHLPYQRELYAPAGALYELGHGAWTAYGCIAVLATAYGFVAFLALLALWNRFFPPLIAITSAFFYPLLAGPALADLSTYSMSTVHAFLFGGTALLATALTTVCHRQRAGWLYSIAAALLFGLAIDTHLIAVLWVGVPAVVALAFLFDAPPMRCRTCGSLPLAARCRRVGVHTLLLPGAAVAIALVLAGWDLARIGVAASVRDGIARLVHRDALTPTKFRFSQGHIVLVTGGIGAYFALVGGLRWAKRSGLFGWLSLVSLAASFFACALQWYTGFPGRLYLPMLAWAVPFMMMGTLIDRLDGRLPPVRWALFALLITQTALTFGHVLGTRRWTPHWGVAEVAFTDQVKRNGDSYITAPKVRTYNDVPDDRTVLWGEPGAEQKIESMLAKGTHVFLSSQSLTFSRNVRDGHLISTTQPQGWSGPSTLEQRISKWGALLLTEPTGRGEFEAELIPAAKAPSLRDRLSTAAPFLDDGALLVAVTDSASPLWVGAYGTSLIDCVNRESYDAFELSAFVSLPFMGCHPLRTGLSDATDFIMRPLPIRTAYRVSSYSWPDSARRSRVEFAASTFHRMPRAAAFDAVAQSHKPFLAIIQPSGATDVLIAIHEIGTENQTLAVP